jgi:DNA-binding PadR family transcriptional regulator
LPIVYVISYDLPISEAIEECSGRDVAIGSVYITLERLERKGLVSFKLVIESLYLRRKERVFDRRPD